jgi:hypothetical protein
MDRTCFCLRRIFFDMFKHSRLDFLCRCDYMRAIATFYSFSYKTPRSRIFPQTQCLHICTSVLCFERACFSSGIWADIVWNYLLLVQINQGLSYLNKHNDFSKTDNHLPEASGSLKGTGKQFPASLSKQYRAGATWRGLGWSVSTPVTLCLWWRWTGRALRNSFQCPLEQKGWRQWEASLPCPHEGHNSELWFCGFFLNQPPPPLIHQGKIYQFTSPGTAESHMKVSVPHQSSKSFLSSWQPVFSSSS